MEKEPRVLINSNGIKSPPFVGVAIVRIEDVDLRATMLDECVAVRGKERDLGIVDLSQGNQKNTPNPVFEPILG